MEIEQSLGVLNLQEHTPEDVALSFQPSSFEEYLGQSAIKEKLKVYTKASLLRQEPLDHVLLFGPPGLGKTTLAHVIAKELGVSCKVTSAPVIERAGDLVALLTNLAPKEILFIDEIHRLPKNIEEILYTAMESFCVDMIIGQGAGAKSIRLPLAPFTLMGATTKTGLISGPLQTRFGIVERLDFYNAQELADIALQNAHFLAIPMEPQAALQLGSRARGTPRIVKRLLRRVRDFAQVHKHETITVEVVNRALTFLGVDEEGLTHLDRKVLAHLIKDFDGGPVGLETMAAITGEDKDTLEDYCEPFLIRQGLLQRTARGRQIPAKKIPHLRRKLLDEIVEAQDNLFE